MGRKVPHGPFQHTSKEFRQLRQRQRLHRSDVLEENARGGSQDAILGCEDPRAIWLPGGYTAFKILLSARLAAALWSSVSDCDETFNYWEPTHLLLYGKGQQTWEYSPVYALRSYLYILVHALPPYLYKLLFNPLPMYNFYLLRCLLALVSALSEVYFYRGVTRVVGVNIGRLTLAFMVFGAGFFISTTAFLPSSTSMILCMISYGAWFRGRYALAIFTTALSSFLSWPFSALLGVPVAVDILFRQRKLFFFFQWSLISAATILLPQITIDSDYYGRFVCAPFNIIHYNVLGSSSDGPNLYGTEPTHFYFVNGILNFNIAFILAIACPVLVTIIAFLPPLSRPASAHIKNRTPSALIHSGLFMWLVVFVIQPHKEERFLFPAYPLICLSAATSLDAMQKICFLVFGPKARCYMVPTRWMALVTIAIYTILSLCRIAALYNNYHAAMDIWISVAHLPHISPPEHPVPKEIAVCVGKEWHRFTSSFFLPSSNWELKYLKSEFRGQLPQSFAAVGTEGIKDATRSIRQNFNDANKEEIDRYVLNEIKECHYLVDQEVSKETKLEPRYSADNASWEIVTSFEFLDAANSGRFFRSFYVPVLSRIYCRFNNYVLLKNVAQKNFEES